MTKAQMIEQIEKACPGIDGAGLKKVTSQSLKALLEKLQ